VKRRAFVMVAVALIVGGAFWYSHHRQQQLERKQFEYASCMQQQGYGDALKTGMSESGGDFATFTEIDQKCKKAAGLA